MVFCLLVFASPGPFTELGSADGKPLSATSAPAAGCVIHTLIYYITFSPCAQLFCPVSAEKLTCFRRIPFSSPMLFYRLIVFNGRGVSQHFAHGTFQLLWAGEASLSPCSAPSPMRALVFRSAYSASRNARASAAFAASIKAHCAVGTETLMLQVRCANPPMPHRTSSSSRSGVPHGLFSLSHRLQNAG